MRVTVLVLLLATCIQSQERDPYDLLKKHYRTIGLTDSAASWKTYYAEGTAVVNNLGTEGRFREWRENPMRMRMEGLFLGFTIIYGDNGEFTWRKEASGDLILDRDTLSLRNRRSELLLSQFEHLNQESQVFALSYAGTTDIGSTTCYAVEIISSLADDTTTMYIDTSTYYLKLRLTKSNGTEFHEYFSDYRSIGRLIRPFKDSTFHVGEPSPVTYQTTKFILDARFPDSVYEPSTDTLADAVFD